MDSRVKQLAKILTHYSINVKEGEQIIINGTSAAQPLVLALQEEMLKAGGFPVFRINLPGMDYNFFKYSNEKQLKFVPKSLKHEMEEVAGEISIISNSNTNELSNINPKKQRMASTPEKLELNDIILQKKWNITLFPTEAMAQNAEMSLKEFEDFVYKATNQDWEKISKEQQKIADIFNKGKEARIVGKETDITLKFGGRTFVNCDGKYNMPDGEVFTSPLENSANGHIYYEFPTIYKGREVSGVRLKFENGKVTRATAEKNQKFLEVALNTDAGSILVGELGLGNNYGIKKAIKEILFDEKIGGTIHIALGASYPESGGQNKSSIHWDMIKDLRKGGAIYLDGKLVQKDGKWAL